MKCEVYELFVKHSSKACTSLTKNLLSQSCLTKEEGTYPENYRTFFLEFIAGSISGFILTIAITRAITKISLYLIINYIDNAENGK